MISITKYVLLHMLARPEKSEVDEGVLSKFLTQILPINANLVSNSSPFEIKREIKKSVMQINRRCKTECGGECLQYDPEAGKIKLQDPRNECYMKVIKKTLEKYEELAREPDRSLLGLYIALVKPHVEHYLTQAYYATIKY